MKKLLLVTTAVLALLTACSTPSSPTSASAESSTKADHSLSRSGVEVYGIIDTGIASHKVWR